MPKYTPEEYKKLWNSRDDMGRRKMIEDLLAVYDHDWKGLLDSKIETLFSRKTADKLKQRSDTTLNPLRRAVDELAQIYSKDPERNVNGSIEGLDPYEAMGTLDMTLDQAARLCFLCREILIRPLIIEDYFSGEPRFVFDIITPDKYAVFPHHDPLRVDGLVIELPRKKGVAKFVIWEDDYHALLDAQWNELTEDQLPHEYIGTQGINPYGIIPYLPCHAMYPARGFWHEKESNAIYDLTLTIGTAKTDYLHIRNLQSFKQLAITGKTDKGVDMATVALDPSRTIEVKGPTTDVKVLDMQADLRTHLDTLLDMMEASLNQVGLRPDATRGTMDAQSGYALSIKTHRQEQVWEQQRSIWAFWENRLYQMSRIIGSYDGIALPDGDLQIDYADIGPDENPQEQALLYASYEEHDWVSKAWVQRKLGFSEDEISQIEEEISKEKQQAIERQQKIMEEKEPAGTDPVIPNRYPAEFQK